MSQEHAAAALHAAKMAQLNAMGHSLDKLPASFLPPHLDLSKLNSQNQNAHGNSPDISRIQSSGSVTIEPASQKVPTSIASHHKRSHDDADIRRSNSEPMDLGYDNNQHGGNGGNGNSGGGGNRDRGDRDNEHRTSVGTGGSIDRGGNSSGDDDNYSDDDGEQNS